MTKWIVLAFLAGLTATLPAATLEIAGESFGPMVYGHRHGKDRVLEMTDSADITGRTKRNAEFSLLASDREGDREVALTLKLVRPDGSMVRFDGIPPLKLKKDRMLTRRFRLTLDDADLAVLDARRDNWNLAVLRIEAAFSDPQGNPLPALNEVAAVGFDRGGKPEFPDAKIVLHNGVPTLSINGVFHPGIFGYVGWNWLTARESIRDFAAAGFHLYEIVFQPWTLWKDGRLNVDDLERRLNSQIVSIAAQDPDALIFLRYWLYVPRDWSKFYPDEVIRYDDGSSEIPLLGGPWAHASYASPVWRAQYQEMLRELIARLKKSPYAERIFMVRVGYGNCGEWNSFGYHDSKFPGYSPRMRTAYREWLKKRYGSLDTLNRNWKSAYGDWDSIEVPSRAERLAGAGSLLRAPDGNCADFYRFFSDYTVELIADFGKTVKDASGGKLLYGVFYGYFLHHLTGAPYHSLDSGHYAMGKLLRQPDVETVCSPYNYHRRERAISIGMPLESIKLHGKLFLAEMDLPTHLADPAKYHGTAGEHFQYDAAEAKTLTLYRRDYGRVLTWGVGGYWYDFAHHWYEFEAFRKFADSSARIGREAAAGADLRSTAEVAVILDEESVFSLSPDSGDWANKLRETLGYTLESVGVPIDFWLGSDLDAAVKRGYKLLVFANWFRSAKELEKSLDGYKGEVLLLGPRNAPTGFSAAGARAAMKKAGVHLYSEADDLLVYANASYLGIWRPFGSGSAVTVTLPRQAKLTDAESGAAIPTDGRSFKLPPAKQADFHLFRISDPN